MSDVPTRLLRDTLRDAGAPDSSAGCLDTDTLAAWSDGTLTRRERAAAESHASNCARCQALLAVMVRTQPMALAGMWWHRPALRWLVPIAVGATAIAVWVNGPVSWSDRFAAKPPSPASTTTSATPGDRVASTDPNETVGPPPPAAVMPRRPVAAAEPRGAEAVPERQFDTQARAPVQPSGRTDARRELRESATLSPAAPPPPGPDAASPVEATAAAPPANAATALTATSSFRPPLRRTSRDAAPGAREPALAKTAAVSAPILSPDPTVRWRLAAAGSVDRSADGGTTWQTQSTGVPAMLTAGTAPSPTICWLVGPGGIVVLSVDGRTWERVSIAEAVDLASVRASDSANATVTTVAGRTFTTTDGGKTWRR